MRNIVKNFRICEHDIHTSSVSHDMSLTVGIKKAKNIFGLMPKRGSSLLLKVYFDYKHMVIRSPKHVKYATLF